MRHIKLTIFAVATVCITAPISAHALTYDTHSYRNADGSSKFQDPDAALKSGDKDSGFSMKFSGSSSNQSPDNSERLFLPQSGRASNPLSGSDNFDTALGNNRHW